MNALLHRSFAPFALALSCTLACNNDPAAGKPKAEATAPVEEKTQPSAQASTVEYALSPTSGRIDFLGAKVTDKHEGSFSSFSGTARLVDGNIEKSTVEVSIDTASLQVEPAKLRGHLLSADFFDVEKFPKATFTSTSIKATPAGPAPYEVTGNLDLHGVKKSITFPASIAVGDAGLTIAAEFAINRKDFAIVYPGMPDDLIKDEVLIKLKFDSKKS